INAESSKWLPGGTCPGTGLLPLVNFNRRTGLRGSCRDQNSVQLRDNWRARLLLIFPCKRHHQSTLVFFPPCFASRGSPVRSRPRPPILLMPKDLLDSSIV